MTELTSAAKRLATLRERLLMPIRNLQVRVEHMQVAAATRVATEERALSHIRMASLSREQNRSRDQLVLAKGLISEKLGYETLDDLAILGLEADGPHYALWIAKAAMECEARGRGELLRHIFSCPRRLQWCRAEGARISHAFGKRVDDAKRERFLERQKNGGSTNWRKDPVTSHQEHRMALISVRCGIPVPGDLLKGSAHDWIAINSAHPDFWKAPERMPEWIL
jgi:hypothetical protein